MNTSEQAMQATRTGRHQHQSEDRNILRDSKFRLVLLLMVLLIVSFYFVGTRVYSRIDAQIEGEPVVEVPRKKYLPAHLHVNNHDRVKPDAQAPRETVADVIREAPAVDEKSTDYRIVGYLLSDDKSREGYVLLRHKSGEIMNYPIRNCERITTVVTPEYQCMYEGKLVTRFTGESRRVNRISPYGLTLNR